MTDCAAPLSNPRIREAIAQLLEAYRYAQDTRQSVWTYAIDFASLCADGMSTNDLRWLVCAGYVTHAREITEEADSERKFRRVPNLKFALMTCFVLTEAGALLAERLHSEGTPSNAPARSHPPVGDMGEKRRARDCRQLPKWNPIRRELHIDGCLVKRFRLPSPNQETVLAAFEEEKWPEMIDDPLPQQVEQDPKRRLQDTIKGLNRHQVNRLICFKGNGTGEGILWELVNGASRSGGT